MSTRRIVLGCAALGLSSALLAACSSDSRPPATTSTTGGTSSASGGESSSNSTSSSGSGQGGAGGEAGAAPSGGTVDNESTGGSGGTNAASGGSGGNTVAGYCGDGIVDDDEDCEPDVFESSSCVGFGWDGGETSCTDDCHYDFSDCSGVEKCFDAMDNDGDGDEDCEDEDCSTACASSCDLVPELSDPSFASIDNTGHASQLELSCGVGAGAGPELVYRVEVATTGILDATIDTGGFPEIAVSLRESCEDDDSELACAGTRASALVSEGDIVYVVVQGSSDVDIGDFDLVVQSRRANVCGDGFWDDEEACDDAANADGDGCDASCNVELSETEPNDTSDVADLLEGAFYGQISPAGDVDVVAIEVTEDESYVVLNTYPLVAGGCTFELYDPFLQLIDVDGSTVLAENDDYDGTCSRVIAEGLDAGTYYALVRASSNNGGLRQDFPYRLGATIDSCGNGFWGPLEECDDGNTQDGDGCSSNCENE